MVDFNLRKKQIERSLTRPKWNTGFTDKFMLGKSKMIFYAMYVIVIEWEPCVIQLIVEYESVKQCNLKSLLSVIIA